MSAKLIMLIAILPILPILYGMMGNETKPKKGIILGVTLPVAAWSDARVKEICADFRKSLRNAMLVGTAALGLLLPIERFSIFLTITLIWITMAILVTFWLYARANGKLRAEKRARGWAAENSQVLTIDMSTVDLRTKRVGTIWFVLPLIISLVPVVAELMKGAYIEAAVIGSCGVLLVGVFWGIHGAIYRQRAEQVGEDSDITAVLTRVRRRYGGILCAVSAWISALLGLGMWFYRSSPAGAIGVGIAYTVILLALVLWTEFKTRFVQQKLTAQVGGGPLDEDDLWMFGIIYNNPNDRHIMKNHRVGLGMAINIGRPWGKILGGVCALLIITLPLWGFFLVKEEITPPALRVENGAIYALHTGTSYEIPLNDIRSVELIDALPSMTRTAGTGMDTLLKGRYRGGDGESCRLCLDPTQPPFLKITTPEMIYYVADRDAAKTEQVYAAIGK